MRDRLRAVGPSGGSRQGPRVSGRETRSSPPAVGVGGRTDTDPEAAAVVENQKTEEIPVGVRASGKAPTQSDEKG
jgi:hypothetical protein